MHRAARVLARDGYDGDRMFEVGDRRRPSEPGKAGWVEGRSAVLVMTRLNPEPRITRESRLLSLEGFLTPDSILMREAGRPIHDLRLQDLQYRATQLGLVVGAPTPGHKAHRLWG